jgi:hypothetical protein
MEAEVDIDGDGIVRLDYLGEKLHDDFIDSLWTDRIWIQIEGGTGDIHCELNNQPSDGGFWDVNGTFTCGYDYVNTTSYTSVSGGPSVWVNYDYRHYSNPYSGCYGAASNYVPSGSGGCMNHPSRDGALWIR